MKVQDFENGIYFKILHFYSWKVMGCKMGFLLLIGIVYVLFCCLPCWLEAILLLINLFLPDTVPFIDEIFMVLPIVKKIRLFVQAKEFVESHKVIAAIGSLAVIFLAVILVRGLIWE